MLKQSTFFSFFLYAINKRTPRVHISSNRYCCRRFKFPNGFYWENVQHVNVEHSCRTNEFRLMSRRPSCDDRLAIRWRNRASWLTEPLTSLHEPPSVCGVDSWALLTCYTRQLTPTPPVCYMAALCCYIASISNTLGGNLNQTRSFLNQ